ncbi:MAG TPA: hypothetical protein VJ276_06305 [Thermoanaerobaculia bacterium]|nr:hypothetical protein [Thermoanaerobaculia bacterium]
MTSRRKSLAVSLALAMSLMISGQALAQNCPLQSQAGQPSQPVNQNLSSGSSITYQWSPSVASLALGSYSVWVRPAGSTGNGTQACTGDAVSTSCVGPALSVGTYEWYVKSIYLLCTSGVDSAVKQFTVGCVSTAPTLTAPLANATGIGTIPVLTWSNVGADTYDVYFGSPGSGCSGSPMGTTQGTVTTFTPPSLQPGTTYEWKVAAKKGTCPAKTSSCQSFTTAQACNAPGSFTLRNPVNGSASTSTPTLSWSSSSGADNYNLHLGTTNPPPANANDPSLPSSQTTYTPSTLAPGTYYWYVDAAPACDSSRKTSTSVSSFTICPTGVSSLTAPSDGASFTTSQQVSFNWTAVSGAVGYDLLLSTDGGATFNTSASTTATTISKSLSANDYLALIRTRFGGTCPTTDSQKVRFTVSQPACPTITPTISAPAANADFEAGKPVTFGWSDVDKETGYDVMVSTDGGATFTSKVAVAANITTASATLPAGSYTFYIRANYAAPCAALNSQTSRFTVTTAATCPTTAPTLTSPANGAALTDDNVRFAWQAVAGATQYRLMLASNGGSASAVTVTSDTEFRSNAPAGSNEWYVQAIFGGTTCGTTESQHFRFTLPAKPVCATNPGTATLTSPADGATNVTSPVDLRWSAVGNAASYRVFASLNNAFPVLLGTTTSTSLTVNPPAGTVSWYVETTFGTDCPTTVSGRSTFTVVTPTTCNNAGATLTSPANGAANVGSTVTFKWDAVKNASGYELFTSYDGADFVQAGETANTTLTRLISGGTSVAWYVETKFPGCPTTKSSTFRFTVEASKCPEGSVTLRTPTNGATITSPATFSWSAVTNASSYRLWVAVGGSEPTALARVTGTSATVSLPSGDGEWWVEAMPAVTATAAGDTACSSILSSHGKFTVAKANDCDSRSAPSLVAPLGTAAAPATTDDEEVELKWSTVTGATAYRVWLVTSEGLTDLGLTKDNEMKQELKSGSYGWFVEVFFDGCPPMSSARAFFKVEGDATRCPTDSPSLIAPSDGATNVASPVTLQWSAVAGAIEYRVFAAFDGGPLLLIGTTGETSLTRAVPAGIVDWLVEAVFRECPSTRSARARFTVPRASNCATATPQLLAPQDGAANVPSPVDFAWTPVSNAIKYIVLLRLGDGSLAPIGETSETHLPRELQGGSYEWRVAAIFNGCPVTFSDVRRFSVSSACDNRRPVLLTPADGSRDLVAPVQFTWTRVRGAKQYRLWLANRGAEPTVLGVSTDNSMRLDVPAGINHWFVEVVFDGCPPIRSAVNDFLALNAAPPCRTPDRPLATVIGQTLSGTPYSVRWTPVVNANVYEIQEATSLDFSGATTKSVSGISASFTHTATDRPQQYLYRVRAVSSCSDERGPYSNAVGIFITPLRPTAKEQNASAEVGLEGNVVQTLFLEGSPTPVTFTATVDRPWLTVTPSSGTLGPAGQTLTVTADASVLPPGTNTATVKVSYGSSGSGKVKGNAVTPKSVPVSVTLVSPVAPGGRNTPPPDAQIIPAVAHAAGANGSLFESDVRLTNLSAQTMKYMLNFTPSGVDGTVSGNSMTVQVDPGGTMALDDILASFFGSGSGGASSTGMLEIRPLASSSTTSIASLTLGVKKVTVASSRTYNFTDNGTFGQFIPAIPFAQFIGKGAGILSLQQIAQSTIYRTNFGLVEGSGEPADVILRVFNTHGDKLQEIPVSLLAGEHRPLNSLLATYGITLDDGRIEVEVTSSTGKVTAYASTVDNRTNDPLLVPPVLKGAALAGRYVLPGMADINNGIASWRSDIRIFNSGSESTPATLTYYPQGDPASAKTASITVNGGEIKAIDNALQSLFGVTSSGGSVVVTTPSNSALVVTARTYNQTSTGTYGQFIAGVTPDQSIALGDDALQILQIEQSDRIRTNIGVDETTGNGATVEVSLVLPDSKVTAKTSFDLAPNEFRQFSVADFGAGTTYNARVTVKVISGSGKVTAYGSAIDQITQDPTYVMPQ